MPSPLRGRVTDRTRDRGSLAIGSIANGALAYVFVALGTRVYGAAAFAPLSVVWSLWALGVAVLTFPFQHRMINVVRTAASDQEVGRERRRLLLVALGASATMTLGLLPVRSTIFRDDGLTYPVVTGLVVLGSAVLGLLRGQLSGLDRHVQTSITLWAEQLVRLVAGVVVVAVGGSVVGYVWALPLGVLAAVAWPGALVARARGVDAPTDQRTSLSRYLVAVAGGTALAQLVLSGSPVVLSAVGADDAEVTGLFTTIAVSRAPYLVALGAAVQLMSDLTDRVGAAGAAGVSETARRTVKLTSVAAVVVAPVAAALGPTVLGLVFGGDAALDALATAAVAGAAVLAVGSLVLTLVAIATDAVMRILVARGLAVAAFLTTSIVPWTEPLTRVVTAFAISELIAFVLMAGAVPHRGARRPEAAHDPSSPRQ